MGGMNELAAWLSDPVVFWTALGVIVTLSGLVATVVTTAVSALVRRRSRPEADWVIDADAVTPALLRGQLSGALMNVGDAPAFNVRVTANRGQASFGSYQPSGHTLIGPVFVTSKLSPLIPAGGTETFEANFREVEWGDLELTITWITSPTRLKKELHWTWKPSTELELPRSTTA